MFLKIILFLGGFFILAAIIEAIIKSPWLKGSLGEFNVNLSIKTFLDQKKYRLIRNVILRTEDGTTQIDHVVVSIYGIFVIETKNMKGWIFGSAEQKTWTQKIYKEHSSKFQNPLFQNYKHVKTLQSLLGLENNQLYSLVVFTGDSKFKTDMPENVTIGDNFIKYIKSKKEEIFTEHEVAEIVDKIEEDRLPPSLKAEREHIKHVRKIVNEASETSSSMIIPKKVKRELKMKYQCPYCNEVLSEDTIMEGKCQNCKKVIDFTIVKKEMEKIAPSEEKPITEEKHTGETKKSCLISAFGRDGGIEVFKGKIVILRGESISLRSGKFRLRSKEFWINSISSIQFKEVEGIFSPGFIKFALVGEIGNKPKSTSNKGIFSDDKTKDENAVLFNKKEEDLFRQVKAEIEKQIEESLSQQQAKIKPATALDELEKLASLKEKGIITQEEFQAKKKKLLEI